MGISEKPISQTMGRRLTTLMAVDICNFTGKIEKNERAAIKLTDLILSVLTDVVHQNNGRVFKVMGDGFLVEFPSARLGLLAAIDFYQELKDRAHISATNVRTALHVGDVTLRDDGDLMGHGVNIVSRLQDMATPGTVLISSNFYNLVGNEIEFKVRKRDGLKLKNISERLTAFEFTPGNGRIIFFNKLFRSFLKVKFAPIVMGLLLGISVFLGLQVYKSRAPVDLMTKASQISVAGFENNTSQPELDYLAEGMTDVLTNSLFQVEGLSVKRGTGDNLSFESSSSASNSDQSELIFNGRFVDNQDAYMLIAQVARKSDNTIAWSKSFDFEDLPELLNLQTTIATDIADALGVVTSDIDQDRMAQIGTENINAFIAFQRGRTLLKFWHQDRNNPDMIEAFRQITRASELDPNWAEPRLHIVDIYHHFINGDIPALPETDAQGSKLGKFEARIAIEYNLRQASETATSDIARNKALMNAYFFSDNWRGLRLHAADFVDGAVAARGELEWLFEPIILLVLGEYDLSLRLADDRILKYDPKNGTGHAYAIRTHLLQNNIGIAETRLENAKSLTFSNRLEEVEGFILVAKGDGEALETHLATARKLSPMHQAYFAAIAMKLNGKTSEALEHLETSEGLNGNIVYRAFALNHLGDRGAAKSLFEDISKEPLGDLDIATALAYGAGCGLKDFQIPLSLQKKLKAAAVTLPPCMSG